MDLNIPASSIPQRTEPGRLFVRRVLALLLLLVVPAFITQARTNWYLPQSNPGHYLTVASKTVVHSPVAIENAHADFVSGVFAVMPETRMARPTEAAPRRRSLQFTTPLLRRPPPAFSL
jgi:hypothetical protein